MPERDVVAWTVMIDGNTSCNFHRQAWTIFCEMLRDCTGVEPNEYTFSCAIKACKSMKSGFCGSLVHGLVLKFGMHRCIYVENALLDLYATCCETLKEACLLFQEIRTKSSVSWTTLITGYTHKGDASGALRVFKQMLSEEAEVNPYSISIAVKACASIGSHIYGKQVHATVIKNGFESNTPVMNSMLDMYCRSSSLTDADQCFKGMAEKDLITWNTLIAGYKNSHPNQSLNIYSQMESEGFNPNSFTFTSILAAMGNLAALSTGEQVHAGIITRGLVENLEVGNALIDMYAKCGNIVCSRRIFDEMYVKNLVSWTSMMIGYGSHGRGKDAVRLFNEMVKCGIVPDRIVFMAVLSACSHAGLVDEGLRHFKSMADYNIVPELEIYGCVVDLLGRAGRIEEAYEMIKTMPFSPDDSVWGAFLGACKKHMHRNLGKLAVNKVLEMQPDTATYVSVANLYAADGKWGEFARTRKLMRRLGIKKETGKSWVELQNKTYCFVAGDKLGSHIEWVYQVLGTLFIHLKDAENFPDLVNFLHDFEDGT